MIQFLNCMREIAARDENVLNLIAKIWFAYGGILVFANEQLEFSAFRLGLELLPNDTLRPGPSIQIKLGSGREKEALAHELLHLDLGLSGYPRLVQNTFSDGEQRQLANSILNIADHRVMRPMFEELGLDPERFMSTQDGIAPQWAKHVEAFESCDPYASPCEYLERASTYLHSFGIADPVWGACKAGAWQVIQQ